MHLRREDVEVPRPKAKKATSQAGPSNVNQDEGQSSSPTYSSTPSFMNASFRVMLQEELDTFESSLLKKSVEDIKVNIILMLPIMERHNLMIKNNMEELVKRVGNLEEAVAQIVKSQSSSHAVHEQVKEQPQEGGQAQDKPISTEPTAKNLVMAFVATIQEEEKEEDENMEDVSTPNDPSNIHEPIPLSSQPPSFPIEPLLTPIVVSTPIDCSPTFELPSIPSFGSTADLFGDAKGGDD